jgi:hypothetical protein
MAGFARIDRLLGPYPETCCNLTKIFCGQCLYFTFQHTNICIINFKSLLCLPKSLIPWRDSNPGLLVPEADAMSTAPRRQGTSSNFHTYYLCRKLLQKSSVPKFFCSVAKCFLSSIFFSFYKTFLMRMRCLLSHALFKKIAQTGELTRGLLFCDLRYA